MDDRAGKIVGAMTVTAFFAIFNEYKTASTTKPDPFKIILGAGAASLILVGMTELGEAPSEFAQGLAFVAVLVAALVKGGPVWTSLEKALGASNTGNTGLVSSVVQPNAQPAGPGGTSNFISGPTGNTGATSPTQNV